MNHVVARSVRCVHHAVCDTFETENEKYESSMVRNRQVMKELI